MKRLILTLFILSLCLPVFSAQAVETGTLIKGESFSAVYYYAQDGKRYVFPNARIYHSWYEDFSEVVEISDEELFNISLGGNVFYKPNSRLVKITTNPKVYWVDKNGRLRHVASEEVAKSLFGDNWVEQIDDLPDEFFTGYTIDGVIDFNHYITIENGWTIDQNRQYQHQEQNQNQNQNSGEDSQNQNQEQEQENIVEEVDAEQQPESINLTIKSNYTQDITLEWTVTGGNTDYGFIIVRSETNNPQYLIDESRIDTNASATVYEWNDLPGNKAYYFRVCRRNSDGTCGIYSDVESITTGVTDKVPNITLTGQVENGVAKLSWNDEWISPNNGWRIMRATSINPEYKTHPSVWVEDQEESFDWAGLSVGTYYFRVCNYTNSTVDDCDVYSNNLELTISQ